MTEDLFHECLKALQAQARADVKKAISAIGIRGVVEVCHEHTKDRIERSHEPRSRESWIKLRDQLARAINFMNARR